MGKLHWDLIKVLVADDDKTILSIFKKALKKLGCTGAYVANGKEAVQMMKNYRFDICFMDLLMVELGGIDATIIIRRNFDKTIPIIGMSASMTNEIKDKCLKIGMDNVMDKPVSFDMIKDLIVRFVTKEEVENIFDSDVKSDSDMFWKTR